MQYNKQPLDYSVILAMLKNRGLIVQDDNKAIAQLKVTTFSHDLAVLLEKHPNVDASAMGFPLGWQEEGLWQ